MGTGQMEEKRREKLEEYLRHIDAYLARALSLHKAYRSEDAAVIRAQVLAVLRAFPSLGLAVEVPEGVRKAAPRELAGQSQLMGISGTIPVAFRGARYQIPVALVLSPLFPHAAPLCWVLAEKGMEIGQRHSTVDLRGQCHLAGLAWAEGTHTLMDAAREMQRIFSLEPPLFSSQLASQPPVTTPLTPAPSRERLQHPVSGAPSGSTLERHSSLNGGTELVRQHSTTTVPVRQTASAGPTSQAEAALPYMLALEPGKDLLNAGFARIRHLYLRHKQEDEAAEASMGMLMNDLEDCRLTAPTFLKETRRLAREQFFQRAAVCQIGTAIKLMAQRAPPTGPSSFLQPAGQHPRQFAAESATVLPSDVAIADASSLAGCTSLNLGQREGPNGLTGTAHECCRSHSAGHDPGLEAACHLNKVSVGEHRGNDPRDSPPGALRLAQFAPCQGSRSQRLVATEDPEVEAHLRARMREDAGRLAEEVRRVEAAWDGWAAERLEQSRRKEERRQQERRAEIERMVQEGRRRAEEERRQLELRLAATAAAHAQAEWNQQKEVHCMGLELRRQAEHHRVEEQRGTLAQEEAPPGHANELLHAAREGLKRRPARAEQGQLVEQQKLEELEKLEMEKLRQDMQWKEDPAHALCTIASERASYIGNHEVGQVHCWREEPQWQDREAVATRAVVMTVDQGFVPDKTPALEYETDEQLAARLQAMELKQASSLYGVRHGFLTSNDESTSTADGLNCAQPPPPSKQSSFLFSNVDAGKRLAGAAASHRIEHSSMPFFYPSP